MTSRRRYEALVIAALDGAGVKMAMRTGRPEQVEVSIQSPDASDVVLLQLDFATYPTAEERAASCMAAAAQVVDKLMEIAERERKKVACCPTCNAWFPSFAARNEHRVSHVPSHCDPLNDPPAAAQVVPLHPENPGPVASVSGGLVEW